MLLFMAAASDITFVLTTIGDEAISFINWAAGWPAALRASSGPTTFRDQSHPRRKL